MNTGPYGEFHGAQRRSGCDRHRPVSSRIATVTREAGETDRAAGDLSKQSNTLRHEVDGFLAKIRAA